MGYFASYDFYLIGKGVNVEECESTFGLAPHVCLLEGDEVRHKPSGRFLRFRDETVWGITSVGNVDSHIPEDHEKWLVELVLNNKMYIKEQPNTIIPFFEILIFLDSLFISSSIVIGKDIINLSQCIGAEIGVISRKS